MVIQASLRATLSSHMADLPGGTLPTPPTRFAQPAALLDALRADSAPRRPYGYATYRAGMARARCDEEHEEDPSSAEETHLLLWLSSLLFILGKSVSFVLKEGSEQVGLLIASFAVGLLACAIQFTLGSHLARRIGVEEVACRQSMGQKNTALTLWLCITFMHPLVAPGIAGYIAWQNFFLTYYMNRRSRLKG